MRPSFRRGNLSRLGGTLNSTMDELGLRTRILEHQTLAKWKQVVGPHIAAATVAERVRDGILFVCCKSSMWASECTFHKTRIIKELNRTAGRKVVSDIRFSSRGYRRALEESLKSFEDVRSSRVGDVELDPSVSELAAKLASSSPSEELAKRIRHAVMTGKRLEKARLDDGWKKCPKCGSLHQGKADVCDTCG